MGKLRSIALLVSTVYILCAAHGAHAVATKVSLSTLILTTPGWTEFDHVQQVLGGYGAPLDVRVIQTTELNTLDMNSVLINPDGSGAYGFLVVTPANVINIFGGVLNTSQINQIYAYQDAYNVRMALEGPYVPTFGSDIAGGPPGLGVALVNAAVPSPPTAASGAVATGAPLAASGIVPTAQFDFTGLYTTPVNITNTTRSQAAITCTGPAGYQGVAATVTKFDDGRQQFTTYFPCAAFAADCLLVAHMYYAWGMHGIIPGSRKALFSTQIDDLFLDTQEPFNLTADYRMVPADSQALIAFAAAVPGMPAGSTYRPEIVYNNGGYISYSQNDAYYNVFADDEPADTLQTFQKPPGSGVNLMPVTPDISFWDPTSWPAADPLYNEMAFGASGLQYFMGHHTWSHENLNNVTYNDAYWQIRLNQAAAAYWNTTNGSFNRFSQTAMVTPAISGFRNVDALQALLDCGITGSVGDTSWPHLRNQVNPWQGVVLSKAANATVDGYTLIPRSPTEIYYDVSTEDVETQLYNWFYCCNFTATTCTPGQCTAGAPFTVPSVWSDILSRESLRVLRLLLALRPDGHQFHQANLRSDAGSGNGSLISQWITHVIALYSSKVSWPLFTLKLDDQLTNTRARAQHDNCNLSYSLTFDNVTLAASSLQITAGSGSCSAPVMLESSAVTGATTSSQVASEPTIYSTAVTAGAPVTLTFGSGITW